MAEAVVVVSKQSPVRRRAIEGSLGLLAGLVLACFNGPALLSVLYTPPSGDALSCGPTVNNALAYFVKLQLVSGAVGGALVLVASFLLRRTLRKRREGRVAATP
jgi:hypothetical protein